MNAFVLEVVDSAGAKRGGRTYWTREAAVREAERLVRVKRAAKVRILEVTIREKPVAEVPAIAALMATGLLVRGDDPSLATKPRGQDRQTGGQP